MQREDLVAAQALERQIQEYVVGRHADCGRPVPAAGGRRERATVRGRGRPRLADGAGRPHADPAAGPGPVVRVRGDPAARRLVGGRKPRLGPPAGARLVAARGPARRAGPFRRRLGRTCVLPPRRLAQRGVERALRLFVPSGSDVSLADQLDERRGGSVGVGISLPVFDRGSIAAAKQRARVQLDNAQSLESQRQPWASRCGARTLNLRAAQQQLRAARRRTRRRAVVGDFAGALRGGCGHASWSWRRPGPPAYRRRAPS